MALCGASRPGVRDSLKRCTWMNIKTLFVGHISVPLFRSLQVFLKQKLGGTASPSPMVTSQTNSGGERGSA